MKVGDIVKTDESYVDSDITETNPLFGMILEININMWNEETIPSGVRVMWPGRDSETVYSDEIEVVSENR